MFTRNKIMVLLWNTSKTMQILVLGHRFDAMTMHEHGISMVQYIIPKKAMMAGKTMLDCYGIRTKKSTYQPPSLLFHGVQQLGKLFEGLSWKRNRVINPFAFAG